MLRPRSSLPRPPLVGHPALGRVTEGVREPRVRLLPAAVGATAPRHAAPHVPEALLNAALVGDRRARGRRRVLGLAVGAHHGLRGFALEPQQLHRQEPGRACRLCGHVRVVPLRLVPADAALRHEAHLQLQLPGVDYLAVLVLALKPKPLPTVGLAIALHLLPERIDRKQIHVADEVAGHDIGVVYANLHNLGEVVDGQVIWAVGPLRRGRLVDGGGLDLALTNADLDVGIRARTAERPHV
mmetsp:Transcript_56060/g.157254  ORF Transcript_56060/g.157254 Transcript_56060/m.157254 type:complete len:241 (-) Transcript_56060:1121-1843(-)